MQGRAFSRGEALAAGITARMLQHPRFEEVFPAVYVVAGTTLTDIGQIEAARLALPGDAALSHVTRFRPLGLGYGHLRPLHFTLGRDLHLAIPGIFLHRTEVMPQHGIEGVSVAAAFVGAASYLRLIDLIKIGDWLLHRELLDLGVLMELAITDAWRPGAAAAIAVIPHLDARSRSVKESETRALFEFAGLPRPEVNADLFDAVGTFLGCVDLLYLPWRLVIEYEGRQHAFDDDQFAGDINRYAGFRSDGWEYVQVTNAMLQRPRNLVRHVHRLLIARGYDGPDPVFGPYWNTLFARPKPSRPASEPRSPRFPATPQVGGGIST